MERPQWIDITDDLDASARLLLPNEIRKSCQYNAAVAMNAVVIGCSKTDLGYPVNERVTLKSLQKKYDIQPICLESVDTYPFVVEQAVDLIDGLLCKMSEYVVLQESFYDTIGCCVFLHSDAFLLRRSSTILQTVTHGILHICELATRLRSLFTLFVSLKKKMFHYSSSVVWQARQQSFGENQTLQFYRNMCHQGMTSLQQQTVCLQHQEKAHIRVLPLKGNAFGQLSSVDVTLHEIMAWIQTHPQSVYIPLRRRLWVVVFLLRIAQQFEDVSKLNDVCLTQMLHTLLQLKKHLKRIRHDLIKQSKRNAREHSSTSHESTPELCPQTQKTAPQDPREHCESLYFNSHLTQYMSVLYSCLIKKELSRTNAIRHLEELVLQSFYILLVSRAASEYPFSMSHFHRDFLRQMQTKYRPGAVRRDTVHSWNASGTAISCISFVFSVIIFPLLQRHKRTLATHNATLNGAKAALKLFSRIIQGPVINRYGEETTYNENDVNTILHEAGAQYSDRLLQEVSRWDHPKQNTEACRSGEFDSDEDTYLFCRKRWITIYARLFLIREFSFCYPPLYKTLRHANWLIAYLFKPAKSQVIPVSKKADVIGNLCALGDLVSTVTPLLILSTKLDHCYTGLTITQGLQQLKTLSESNAGPLGSQGDVFRVYYMTQRARVQLHHTMLIAAHFFSMPYYPLAFHALIRMCYAEAILEAMLLEGLGIKDFHVKDCRFHKSYCLAQVLVLTTQLFWAGHIWGHTDPLTQEQCNSEKEVWGDVLYPLLDPLLIPWRRLVPQEYLDLLNIKNLLNENDYRAYLFQCFQQERERYLIKYKRAQRIWSPLPPRHDIPASLLHRQATWYVVQLFQDSLSQLTGFIHESEPSSAVFYTLHAHHESRFLQNKTLTWLRQSVIHLGLGFMYAWLNRSSKGLTTRIMWETPWCIPFIHVHTMCSTSK